MPSLQAAPKATSKTPAKASGKGAMKAGGRKGALRQVIKKLNLSVAQQAKIETLWKKSQANLKALRANKTLTNEQKHARRQVIQSDRNAQMRQLLTTAQRQKLDAMLAEMKKNRKKP
jgi:Spy/CpxP family protein refolding chaperone